MSTASPTPLPLDECRTRASLLLKDLRASDVQRAQGAAERLRALPGFASVPTQQLLREREHVQRRHALACIAHEQGFASWAQLKRAREAALRPVLDTRTFFRGAARSFLNRWFSTYAQARESLRAAPGFLFPYGEQFFVCEPGFVKALGLDPAHPDWERISHDWVQPRDAAARERLEARLVQLGYVAQGGSHV